MKNLRALFIVISSWTMVFSPMTSAQVTSGLNQVVTTYNSQISTAASAFSLLEKSDKKWADSLKRYFKQEKIPASTKLPKLSLKNDKMEFELQGEIYSIKTSPEDRNIEISYKDKSVVVDTAMTIEQMNSILKPLFTPSTQTSLVEFILPVANAQLLYAIIAIPVILLMTVVLDSLSTSSSEYFNESKKEKLLESLKKGQEKCQELVNKASLSKDEEALVETTQHKLKDTLARCVPQMTALCNPLVNEHCLTPDKTALCAEARKLASCLDEAKSSSSKVSNKSRGATKESQQVVVPVSKSQGNEAR